MQKVDYRADGRVLPNRPHNMRLSGVEFRSCRGGCRMDVSRVIDKAVDSAGVFRHAWYTVDVGDKLPLRQFRLFKGAESLQLLLEKYGFQDDTGCVNHRDVRLCYVPASTELPNSVLHVPPCLQTAQGIPQFFRNSGICWFSTLCWVSFANEEMKTLLKQHLRDAGHADLAQLSDRVLFERGAALTMREELWKRFRVGDNIEDPPEMDGKNGFSEFTVLCAKIGMPMIRYRADGSSRLKKMSPRVMDQEGRPATVSTKNAQVLVLRFQDGDHFKMPIHRRIVMHGKRWILLGIYMGQRKCGHQVAMVWPARTWQTLTVGDADQTAFMGPTFVHVEPHMDWRKVMDYTVHMTKFGPSRSQFCPIGPSNHADDKFDRFLNPATDGSSRQLKMSYRSSGSCSNDAVYISCDAAPRTCARA